MYFLNPTDGTLHSRGSYLKILDAIESNGTIVGASENDFIEEVVNIATEFQNTATARAAKDGFIMDTVAHYVAKECLSAEAALNTFHFTLRCTGRY